MAERSFTDVRMVQLPLKEETHSVSLLFSILVKPFFANIFRKPVSNSWIFWMVRCTSAIQQLLSRTLERAWRGDVVDEVEGLFGRMICVEERRGYLALVSASFVRDTTHLQTFTVVYFFYPLIISYRFGVYTVRAGLEPSSW